MSTKIDLIYVFLDKYMQCVRTCRENTKEDLYQCIEKCRELIEKSIHSWNRFSIFAKREFQFL